MKTNYALSAFSDSAVQEAEKPRAKTRAQYPVKVRVITLQRSGKALKRSYKLASTTAVAPARTLAGVDWKALHDYVSAGKFQDTTDDDFDRLRALAATWQ